MRVIGSHILSLVVLAGLAFVCWPAPRGLTCRFYMDPAPAAAPAVAPGMRGGLVRTEFVGQRFARARAARVDAELKALFPAGSLWDASMRWSGRVYVPRGGVWSFGTCSDDGSAVMIDDRLVAVNWLEHSPHTHFGRVYLEPGWHRLRVDYVQIGGHGQIELLWKAPDGPVAPVPPEFLARDRGPEPWLDRAWAEVVGARGAPARPGADTLRPPSSLESGRDGARSVPSLEPASATGHRPARWMWADVWGGPGGDAVLAGGFGEPLPCAGLDAPGVLEGGWRLWRARVRMPWTARVRVTVPNPAPAVVWLGGAVVFGKPDAPAAGPAVVERTLAGGVTEILVATAACAAYPPLKIEAVAGEGPPPGKLELEPPALAPWPAPPGRELLFSERHERVWFWTDTRLQAPYLYRWDTKRHGHPGAVAPLSASWEGSIQVAKGGWTTFAVRSSGRAWLSVGGRSAYKDAGLAEVQLAVELPAGRHPIRLDAYDPGVIRTLGMYWTPPGATQAVLVPPEALAPDEQALPLPDHAGVLFGALVAVLLLAAGGPSRYGAFAARRWAWHAWVVLVALGTVVRLHDYVYVPGPGETFDELTYHMVGTSLMTGATPFGWAWMPPFPYEALVPLHGIVFRLVAPMVAYPPLYSWLIGGVHVLAGATSAFELKLHATRLVPIACSVVTLALVMPLARRLKMRPLAGVLATAFLAVYPQAVVQGRLVKEENLLALLLVLTLIAVLDYRRDSGPVRRWWLVGLVLAAMLTKPMGLAVGALALVGLAWRGHVRAAGLCALAIVLGVLSFAWFGLAWAGEAWFWQMQMFSDYAKRVDVLTPLAAWNTVAGKHAPQGWLLGLWILAGTTLSSLKAGRRRFAALATACYVAVVAATYPAQLNWGWYKIPLWSLFALGFGHQAARLLRRADPLNALVFVGFFLLPTLDALGGRLPSWPECAQVSPVLGCLEGGTPDGWLSPRLVVRLALVALVCPTFVVGWLPRGPRRIAAALLGALILALIGASMALLAWHWDLVYPTDLAGDPWGQYENAP